jgi:hypothetical protein
VNPSYKNKGWNGRRNGAEWEGFARGSGRIGWKKWGVMESNGEELVRSKN